FLGATFLLPPSHHPFPAVNASQNKDLSTRRATRNEAPVVPPPLVSVIITTRNEESVLVNALRSVHNQTYSKIETIVVDNQSTDATKAVARRFTPLVYDHGPERCAQRNFGIDHANGAYILIIDADMELTSTIVNDCIRQVCKDPAVKAIVIPEESFGEGYWSACKSLERSCYVDDLVIEGARFAERRAILTCGGFDEKLVGGEDWDLTQRLRNRYSVGRICSVIRHNERKLTLRRAVRKKYYYASTYALYIRKHGRIAFQQANMIMRPAYLRSWRRLVKHPALLAGMFYMRTVEMGGACLGLFVGLTLSRLASHHS
ncbi:MAG: glycosyltransferase family 2 protein, partial [Dehalococcoidia bacterium]